MLSQTVLVDLLAPPYEPLHRKLQRNSTEITLRFDKSDRFFYHKNSPFPILTQWIAGFVPFCFCQFRISPDKNRLQQMLINLQISSSFSVCCVVGWCPEKERTFQRDTMTKPNEHSFCLLFVCWHWLRLDCPCVMRFYTTNALSCIKKPCFASLFSLRTIVTILFALP